MGEHEHQFQGPVTAFHDVMSPLWHAEAGPQRVDDTCAHTGDLMTQANGIVDAGAPAEARDAALYQQRAQALAESVGALQITCAENRASFAASFAEVHDAFHALIEVLGEKHE